MYIIKQQMDILDRYRDRDRDRNRKCIMYIYKLSKDSRKGL